MHASPEEPFLSVSLALDRATLIELAEHLPQTDQKENAELPPEAIFVFEPTEDLLFDFERLIKLLKTPELAPLRAPCIIRDIHSLLLAGPTAARLLPLLRESAPANTSFVLLGGCGAISIRPYPLKLWRSFTACRRRIFIANLKPLPA